MSQALKHGSVSGVKQIVPDERLTSDPPVSSGTFDLLEPYRIIRRRMLLFCGAVLVAFLCGFAATTLITPLYEGEARLIARGPQPQIEGFPEPSTSARLDPTEISSRIEILKSKRLASTVVNQLSDRILPAFRSNAHSAPGIPRLLPALNSFFGRANEDVSDPTLETPALDLADVFVESLEVKRVKESRVISIKYVSKNAELAATAANKLADSYVADSIERRTRSTRLAAAWLNQRIDKLKTELDEANLAIMTHRESRGALSKVEQSVFSDELDRLSDQRARLKSQILDRQYELSLARPLLDAGRFSTLAELRSSEFLERELRQESELARKQTELELTHGPLHPRALELTAKLSQARRRVGEAGRTIVLSMEQEIASMNAHLATLTQETDQLKSRAAMASEATEILQALERRADFTSDLLETFLERHQTVDGQSEIIGSDAEVLSYAGVPSLPVFPKKKALLAVTGVLSVLFGLTAVYAIEALSPKFWSAKQLANATGLTVLGVVPERNSRSLRQIDLAERIAASPPPAIRAVYSSLLVKGKNSPRIILITSSTAGEGKTVLSWTLANMAAQSGHKVLLVDADISRDHRDRFAPTRGTAGVTEYAFGTANVEDIVHTHESLRTHYIPCGTIYRHGSEALALSKVAQMLSSLRENYDVIFIDSASLSELPEIGLLSQVSDSTILAVRWNKTRRPTVQRSIHDVVSVASDCALVMTRVPDRRAYAWS